MTQILQISGLYKFGSADLIGLRQHLETSGLHQLDGLIITGMTKEGSEPELSHASWLVKQCMTLFDLEPNQVTLIPSGEDTQYGYGFFDTYAHQKSLQRPYYYIKPRIVTLGDAVQLVALNTIVFLDHQGLTEQTFETAIHQAIIQAPRGDLKRIFAFYHPIAFWNFGFGIQSILNTLARGGELHLLLSGWIEAYIAHHYHSFSSAPGQVLHVRMTGSALQTEHLQMVQLKGMNRWLTKRTRDLTYTAEGETQCG